MGHFGPLSYMKISLVFFFEKKFHFGQFDLFRPFFTVWLGWSKLSQATVTIGSLNSQDMISFMITTGSLNNQDMIRILKQSRHVFSSKHLCDGYCMNIMWCLCVDVKIQQRVIWFCKASLRICYVNSIWMKRSLNAKNFPCFKNFLWDNKRCTFN